MGWGYGWVLCNVYWLVLLSLNIEKKAAKWITKEELPREGMGTGDFISSPGDWGIFLPLFFFIIQTLIAHSRFCHCVTLTSPNFPNCHLHFLASHLSLSLPTALPNSPATLHCLYTHLRLTAINGDAAIKDEPGTVNWALLAPLRVMELDRSPDTSLSDGEQETIKDISGLWVESALHIYLPLVIHSVNSQS